MDNTVFAVIGMNYGDEGKGHITNFLSHENMLNIRFNGGAQAAHGVSLSNGTSHVFHHLGAGTLRGARTVLSRQFIVNPIMFVKELGEIKEKHIPVKEVFIDPRCIITTPYDILINHFVEEMRGTHTSTGTGINETVERSMYDELFFSVRQAVDMGEDQIMEKIVQIENEWIPFRIQQLKYDPNDFKRYASGMVSDQMVETYIKYVKWMLKHAHIWNDSVVIDRFIKKYPSNNVVFEGAQGMLLDQKRMNTEGEVFLTRSHTDLHNVIKILDDMNSDVHMQVIGVTRAYLTRHGDGPIYNEVKNSPYAAFEKTNPENKYQGKMRYGTFHMKWYIDAIHKLKDSIKDRGEVVTAITCLDHTEFDDAISTGDDGEGEWVTKIDSINFPEVAYTSHGPTEKDIRKIN